MHTDNTPTSSSTIFGSRRRRLALGGLVAAIGLTAGLLVAASSSSSATRTRDSDSHAAAPSVTSTTVTPTTDATDAATTTPAQPAANPDNGVGGGSGDDGTDTAPGPVTLVPSPAHLSFGENSITLPLELANTGGSDGGYVVESSASWLSVSPADGTVPAGDHATLDVSVTRVSMSAGEHFDGSLDVYLDEALVASVSVDGSVPPFVIETQGPEILDVSYTQVICGAGGPITQQNFATVAAAVETHGTNTTVTLDWEWAASSGSKDMPFDGDTDSYHTVLGPYPAGSIDFTVTASSVVGSDSSGPYTVHVVPCP
jgi:hypothetical protein